MACLVVDWQLDYYNTTTTITTTTTTTTSFFILTYLEASKLEANPTTSIDTQLLLHEGVITQRGGKGTAINQSRKGYMDA